MLQNNKGKGMVESRNLLVSNLDLLKMFMQLNFGLKRSIHLMLNVIGKDTLRLIFVKVSVTHHNKMKINV